MSCLFLTSIIIYRILQIEYLPLFVLVNNYPGDWEAVGEAAALMSDADSQSFAGSLPSVGTASSKGRSIGSAADAERSAELDKLIDKGD